MKRCKKVLALVLTVIMLLSSMPFCVSSSSGISIGDTITLGSYNGEPISWICVDIDDNGPLMLSEKVLCTKEYDAAGSNSTYHTDSWGYIRKNYGSNCWYDSNIRQWLNSNESSVSWTHCPPSYSNESGFLTNFTVNELSAVKRTTRLVNVIAYENKRNGYCEGGSKDTVVNEIYKANFPATNYYYDYIEDSFFLLSAVQFNNIYKSNPNFLKASTKYFTCVTSGNNANCFEWVASVPANSTSLETSTNAYMKLGIRPAFYLYESAITKSEYKIAGRTFDKNIDYFTYYTDSCVYNPELANMTAALSQTAYNESDLLEAYYSLGFDEVSLCDYADDYNNPMSSGCAIAFKKSDYTNETICLISVKGSNNTADWIGNISLITLDNEKHIGFSLPANRIYENIKKLAEEKNIKGNIKYVLTGHSRGAAVANLLAVKLMENGVNSANVYDYNFACPDVACKVYFTKYNNIFNVCNRLDIVPHVPGKIASQLTSPGTSWGKFGETYWFSKYNEERSALVPEHEMSLYLDFMDQKQHPSEWEKTYEDEVFDTTQEILGWLTKIFCPVDVIITDTEGNNIASVINGEVNYYDSSFDDVIILTDGDKKVIYINGDRNFNVNLIGTDEGSMTYSIEKTNLVSGEISESKAFSDITLKKDKKMYSPVSEATLTENIELFVVQNDGEKDVNSYSIESDGTEKEINHIYETTVVEPTCTEKGYTIHTCINCEDEYKDTFVDIKGHTDADSNNSCDVCGESLKECSHICHKTGFMGFIWKILRFFCKLFGCQPVCSCGVAHY